MAVAEEVVEDVPDVAARQVILTVADPTLP